MTDLYSIFLLLSKKKVLVCLFWTHTNDISSFLRMLSELLGVNDIAGNIWKDNKVLPAKSTNKKKIIMHFLSLLLRDLLLSLVGEKNPLQKRRSFKPCKMFFRVKELSSLVERVVAAMSTQGLKHSWAGYTLKVLTLSSARKTFLISN